MKYAKDWTFRISEEAKDWKYYAFLTLTYSDESLINSDLNIAENVEYNGKIVPLYSINKAQIQQYMNRVKCACRRKGIKYKYFGCTEYGPHTLRPHAHILWLFNDADLIKLLETKWKYGFTYFTRDRNTHLKYCSCIGNKLPVRYICKYACKRSTHPFFYKDVVNPDTGEIVGHKWNEVLAQKPFRFMSKNIGLGFAFSQAYQKLQNIATHPFQKVSQDDLKAFNGISLQTIPRYYQKQLLYKQTVPDENDLQPITKEVKMHDTASSIFSVLRNHTRILYKRRLANLESECHDPIKANALLEMQDAEKIASCAEKLQRENVVHFTKSKF